MSARHSSTPQRRAFRAAAPIGARFGRLVVTGEVVYIARGRACRQAKAQPCRCDCGTERIVFLSNLLSGNSRSCGCLHNEMLSAASRKHVGSQTRLYYKWKTMRRRCENRQDRYYKDYGGRGITICDQWREYKAFHDWALANGYRDGLTIERNDVDGNYEPRNCSWITLGEQNLNKRNTVRLTAFGETKPLIKWACDPRCKVSAYALYQRIRAGRWSHEEAITRPGRYQAGGGEHPVWSRAKPAE
jgi:hypothetical protein